MQVHIDNKTERVLKKILGVDDINPIIQDVVDTFISHKVETHVKQTRTIEQFIDDLDK